MFDFFGKLGMDKVVLDDSAVLDNALSFCLKELQLLDQVRVVLVELMILVDVGEEFPVIKVIDGVLENGIGGPVALEATAEPGGEGFQGFVRGIIGRCI